MTLKHLHVRCMLRRSHLLPPPNLVQSASCFPTCSCPSSSPSLTWPGEWQGCSCEKNLRETANFWAKTDMQTFYASTHLLPAAPQVPLLPFFTCFSWSLTGFGVHGGRGKGSSDACRGAKQVSRVADALGILREPPLNCPVGCESFA